MSHGFTIMRGQIKDNKYILATPTQTGLSYLFYLIILYASFVFYFRLSDRLCWRYCVKFLVILIVAISFILLVLFLYFALLAWVFRSFHLVHYDLFHRFYATWVQMSKCQRSQQLYELQWLLWKQVNLYTVHYVSHVMHSFERILLSASNLRSQFNHPLQH